MKLGYIDYKVKKKLFRVKPVVHTFTNGSKLYIFPGTGNKKRLRREILKSGVEIIQKKNDHIFKRKIYLKIILQALKETGAKEVIFSFDNAMEYIDIFNELFNRDIPFSLTDSNKASDVSEYFLETTGQPVKILFRIKNGLYVFERKKSVSCTNDVHLLNISETIKSEFFIKNTPFPIKINSLSILNAALALTEKNIEDIIVNPCIIPPSNE